MKSDPARRAPKGLDYVLVTPAKNEERFIENTIRSVIAQTVQPLRWVIVSDGSTDATDTIVSRYAAEHDWITLHRVNSTGPRNFAGKAGAFTEGYRLVTGMSFDAVGALDADISFDSDYFEFLLDRLAETPELGVVGTPFSDTSVYDYRFVNIEHVSGACQLFRRRCFEDIGGYRQVTSGGIDHIAVLTARMMGWRTRTFTERVSLHHRVIGTAEASAMRAKFRVGRLDYLLGSHPLWECCRALYQATRPPVLLGAVVLFSGYLSTALRRPVRPISAELIAFRRREQMARLRQFALRFVPAIMRPGRAR